MDVLNRLKLVSVCFLWLAVSYITGSSQIRSNTMNYPFDGAWEPGVLRWYLDDRLRFSSKTGVPAMPMHLILCPAIGPDWTGNPDASSKFPQRFEIDWVRVCQRK